MPNGPEMGPGAPESPEVALERRADQTSAKMRETAKNLQEEGGESAAANYFGMLERVSNASNASLPEGVSRSEYLNACSEAIKAVDDAMTNAGPEGRRKASSEDMTTPEGENKIASGIRKAVAEMIGGSPERTSAYRADEKKL